MKNVLISLLFLLTYVSANTCTETYFKAKELEYYPVDGGPQIDSVYEKVDLDKYHNYERIGKHYYRNKKIDRFVSIYIGDVVDTTACDFYHSLDENVLSKKGVEILFSDSSFKDTMIFLEKQFKEGLLSMVMTTKITKDYTSRWGRSYSSGVVNDEYYSESVFRNDSVIFMEINHYNTDHPSMDYSYIVENPNDDFECEKYYDDRDTPSYNYAYKKLDNGFVFEEKNGDIHFRQIFMLYQPDDEFTAIKKRRTVTKISPKSRYFDILGRYRFTRLKR